MVPHIVGGVETWIRAEGVATARRTAPAISFVSCEPFVDDFARNHTSFRRWCIVGFFVRADLVCAGSGPIGIIGVGAGGTIAFATTHARKTSGETQSARARDACGRRANVALHDAYGRVRTT